MELRHLRYFVAVADALNFSKASSTLHVSCPTLSKQIMDLEASLGAPLLERTTRQVRLTIPGEVFLEHARKILSETEAARQSVRDASQGKLGTLRIGNAGALSHSFMPASLNVFRKHHPDIEVALVETGIEEHVTAVQNGALHLGFHVDVMGKLPPGVRHLPVLKGHFHLIHGRDHRLGKLKEVRLADLKDEKFMSFKNAAIATHEKLVADILAESGLKIGPMTVVNGYEVFLAMIAGGDGISLLPRFGNALLLDGLAMRPLKEPSLKTALTVSVVWRERPRIALVSHFVEVVKTASHGLLAHT